MEKLNILSIWIGYFDNETEFEKYIQLEFDEDGDFSSHFMDDFEIEYYDEDFQEAFYSVDALGEELSNLSYFHSYANQLPELNWNRYNSIICLYNFEFHGESVLKNHLKYIGSFFFLPK